MWLRLAGAIAVLAVAALVGCGDGKAVLPGDAHQKPPCPHAVNQAQTLPTITTTRPGTVVITIVAVVDCKP